MFTTKISSTKSTNETVWSYSCGCLLYTSPMNDKGELLLDEYEKLFSERTKIVSVVHVSNVLEMCIRDRAEVTPVAEKAPEDDGVFKIRQPELGAKINVIGQIGLAALNQSTRPKKKSKEENCLLYTSIRLDFQ